MERLTVLMTDTTVDELTAAGYRLLLCPVVRAAPRGEPLLWFQTSTFAMTTELSWENDYAAYTAPGGDGVVLRNTYPADLGSTLVVTASTGTGRVEHDGPPGAVSLLNTTTTGFAAGLATSAPDGRLAPVCGLPLFGGAAATIAPAPRAFLAVATRPNLPGQPVTTVDGPGLLVDLVPEGRTIHFGLNDGWSGAGPWAEPVPTGTDLVPLLVGEL